jgi:hypothetical protein
MTSADEGAAKQRAELRRALRTMLADGLPADTVLAAAARRGYDAAFADAVLRDLRAHAANAKRRRDSQTAHAVWMTAVHRVNGAAAPLASNVPLERFVTDCYRGFRPALFETAFARCPETVCSELGIPLRAADATELPHGMTTPCRYHECSELVVLIAGELRVTLFGPYDEPFLYGAELDPTISEVDVQAPDLAAYPLFAHATPKTARLSAGGAVFVPGGWWRAFAADVDSKLATFADAGPAEACDEP